MSLGFGPSGQSGYSPSSLSEAVIARYLLGDDDEVLEAAVYSKVGEKATANLMRIREAAREELTWWTDQSAKILLKPGVTNTSDEYKSSLKAHESAMKQYEELATNVVALSKRK